MKLFIPILLFLVIGQSAFGQKDFDQLLHNEHFEWMVDSTSTSLTIYYQPNSWTATRIEKVRLKIATHIDSTKAFVGIKEYPSRIHFFIVESRDDMKNLIGWETNGIALPKYNVVTGIGSEKIKSIYSNHEPFHLMATNLWGMSEIWINEGMAVYADALWQGYSFYPLTKYLIDHNRYVPLRRLIKKFRKVDSQISYPLIGSFTKYLEETYGREVIIKIWQGKTKALKIQTGKNIKELEKDWLTKMKTVDYTDIKY